MFKKKAKFNVEKIVQKVSETKNLQCNHGFMIIWQRKKKERGEWI
jgi:hypothetical protein